MKKLLQIILLVQVFLVLCSSTELVALFSHYGQLKHTTSQVTTAAHNNNSITHAYNAGALHIVTSPSDEDSYAMHGLSGFAEETTTFDKFYKAVNYIIIQSGANANSLLLDQIFPASTSHYPFATSLFKKWQPVLQVFRL